jgi:outer membrane protein OmpA-like peptidoglycan-associated protein
VATPRQEGFGPAMPIASNAGDTERQRNRGVEVWLEAAH